jgi:hypothetical protein
MVFHFPVNNSKTVIFYKVLHPFLQHDSGCRYPTGANRGQYRAPALTLAAPVLLGFLIKYLDRVNLFGLQEEPSASRYSGLLSCVYRSDCLVIGVGLGDWENRLKTSNNKKRAAGN